MIIKSDKLIKWYKLPILGRIACEINIVLGIDIPRKVKIGKNFSLPHNSIGTVIHENTTIDDDVKIYQNVTIGRADIFSPPSKAFEGFYIKKGACICAGAKILCKEGKLVIGENSVVAANAVLLNSIGDNEIWGGIPAKLIGYRDDL